MTIEKLKSGNYRLRQMVSGQYYSVVVDHKPTKREAEQLMDDVLASKFGHKGSFEMYANKYIEMKKNVLSPSTLRSYDGLVRNMSDEFKAMKFDSIDQQDVQMEINMYSVGHSPKSVKNMSGFIVAVINMYRPNANIKTTLPQRVRYDYYIPTSEEVKKVIAMAKGSAYEIVLRLGCYGLRRSEAIAVTADSLNGNELLIDKAIVEDTNGIFVEKTTKTEMSTRYIFIDDDLANLIREKGKAYDGYPGGISRALHRFQDMCEVPRFRYHDLRHFFVTELSEANVSEADIMYLGGYSSDTVMKSIYRHNRAEKNAGIRRNAQKIIQALSVDGRG